MKLQSLKEIASVQQSKPAIGMEDTDVKGRAAVHFHRKENVNIMQVSLHKSPSNVSLHGFRQRVTSFPSLPGSFWNLPRLIGSDHQLEASRQRLPEKVVPSLRFSLQTRSVAHSAPLQVTHLWLNGKPHAMFFSGKKLNSPNNPWQNATKKRRKGLPN